MKDRTFHQSQSGRVLVGTSGWSYKHWRGNFYGEESRAKDYLAAYARCFRTAEINNTFYRLPSEAAVKAAIPETLG
jgi:uncharacterized protein YecE (DUF72 family)